MMSKQIIIQVHAHKRMMVLEVDSSFKAFPQQLNGIKQIKQF